MNLHNIQEKNDVKYILVCDDIQEILELIQTVLESEGYEVETANSALAAISKLKIRQPDLLITNLIMPEMNGYDLIYYVRQNLKLNTFPVLIVSATNEQSFRHKDIADFIPKPFYVNEFLEKVNSILELN
ncbi:response regulator [Nostocaceae cyanobacterium CENA357]|uniref:Response regulator n=1 Tax=Atlanticothrix silvestris CENA357 TaxID=1725252 RepID=A0A8J7L3Y9_9CYAN|nr:response regulator [Atlanticothrix silvestris]MBH8553082.1 response regulator [Atlanticothrix silvestris CENA357]